MKRLALLAVLLPLLLAADKPWPQKGDVVYLPSTVRTVLLPRDHVPYERLDCEHTGICWYDIPACEALRIDGVNRRSGRLQVRDPYGKAFPVMGDWDAALERSLGECLGTLRWIRQSPHAPAISVTLDKELTTIIELQAKPAD